MKQEAQLLLRKLTVRTALSRIAVQHGDDGYSRRGHFGSSVVQIRLLMCTPDGKNVFDQEVGSLRDRLAVRGLKVVKSCPGAPPVHLFRLFCYRMYRLVRMHKGTDRWTDRE